MAGKIMSWLRGGSGGNGGPKEGAKAAVAAGPAENSSGGKKMFSSKGYGDDFEANVARIKAEAMKNPNFGKEKKEFTKQEVIEHFSGLAKGFERVAPDLKIPDTLYKRDERGNTFSEKPDSDSSHLSSLVKLADARFPDASELVYTLGIFDTTYQTYFVLVDPRRRLVVVDQLLYLGEGSWDNVAQSLAAALNAKAAADMGKEKYNLIIAESGRARSV